MDFVEARDSDASGGNTVQTVDSTEPNNNNLNWDFSGTSYERIWDGDTNTDWDTDANWSGDTVPQAGENVVFDATDVTNCSLDVNTANLASINFAAGYTGTFDAVTFDVTVAGTVTMASTRIDMGDGTWTCAGVWDSLNNSLSLYVDGIGWVFDPCPITDAAAHYGDPGFEDNGDADSDSLGETLHEGPIAIRDPRNP